jgi:hypothetical protein
VLTRHWPRDSSRSPSWPSRLRPWRRPRLPRWRPLPLRHMPPAGPSPGRALRHGAASERKGHRWPSPRTHRSPNRARPFAESRLALVRQWRALLNAEVSAMRKDRNGRVATGGRKARDIPQPLEVCLIPMRHLVPECGHRNELPNRRGVTRCERRARQLSERELRSTFQQNPPGRPSTC